MQVDKINYQSNNSKINFQAIKSVKYSGLYKKHPEFVSPLIASFQQNEAAMEFCKKYDSNIVFHAIKSGYYSVQSSIHIFFDNPTVGKIKKFFKFITGSEDQVKIHVFGQDLSSTTTDLVEAIAPGNKGVLGSHIAIEQKKIDRVMNTKAAKRAAKLERTRNADNAKKELEAQKQYLDKSISDLINKSK